MSSKRWKKHKLGEIADVQTGPFGSQLHQKDYVSVGTPIITVEHLGENYLLHDDLPRVSDGDRQRLSKYTLKEGDIVFSRVGSVDRRALVKKVEEGWLFSGRCLRVRPTSKQLYSEYLSYYFGLNSFKEYIRAIAVGSTMPSLNTTILSELEIPLPPISTQRRIAGILSALDDKIELNRQTNATLEAMAQAIFKEWFVDFNFPGASGERVESALGMIPKGWRVGKLGDVCKNIRKSVQPREVAPDIAYVGLEHVPRKSLGLLSWGVSQDVGSQKTHFKKYHILFGKLRPYFHKVCIAPFDGICSTDILVIEPYKNDFFSFCLNYLFSDEVITYVSAVADGTRMPRVDWNSISNYEIVLPPSDLASKFNKISFPMYEEIIENNQQSTILAALRDALLPKLMNGEIEV